MSDPLHDPSGAPAQERQVQAEHVLAVRTGHGANCSSIGSVIDTLFATATVGVAVFSAVLGALRSEPVRVVGGPPAKGPPKDPDEPKPVAT